MTPSCGKAPLKNVINFTVPQVPVSCALAEQAMLTVTVILCLTGHAPILGVDLGSKAEGYCNMEGL